MAMMEEEIFFPSSRKGPPAARPRRRRGRTDMTHPCHRFSGPQVRSQHIGNRKEARGFKFPSAPETEGGYSQSH